MNINENNNTHIPVLLQECVDALNISSDGIYIDGTLGGAGHAEVIASKLSTKGTFIGCDVDYDAIVRAQERLKKLSCQKFFIHDNFKNISHIVDQLGIQSVNGILLDLGWSSFQIADPERGLSFMHDGPLDMNLSKGLPAQAGMPGDRLTAFEIVNYWDEAVLADIFYGYGDEVKARVIAKHLVNIRKNNPITTTKQLADEVIAALYTKTKNPHFKIHPATKVFQALRIAVNDELETIKEAVHAGIKKLASGGRFAIITFHSGEDRIVKHLFKQYADEGIIKLTVKKPIVPTLTETRTNPRSRSAKLRVVEKI